MDVWKGNTDHRKKTWSSVLEMVLVGLKFGVIYVVAIDWSPEFKNYASHEHFSSATRPKQHST
jgi:hypothetical protein